VSSALNRNKARRSTRWYPHRIHFPQAVNLRTSKEKDLGLQASEVSLPGSLLRKLEIPQFGRQPADGFRQILSQAKGRKTKINF
jgi:hypothetical protein